jgi:hypothetical protein
MRSAANRSRMARATSSVTHRAKPQSWIACTSGGIGMPAFRSLICDSPPRRRRASQAQLATAGQKIKT